MQILFDLAGLRSRSQREQWLRVGSALIRLELVPHRRARRYVLRLRPDGTARVTVPHRGTLAEARRFAEKNVSWLERQLLRRALHPARPQSWRLGDEILFRGQLVRLESSASEAEERVRFGLETLSVSDLQGDLRPEIKRHLRRLAERELPRRVLELAALHQISIGRVSVRNQRSRWGSCSRRGTVSLNWRLIQTPEFVRDYIILHELAHRKEMNHSPRFWAEVARLCPALEQAESWLKTHSRLLAER